MNQSVRDQMDVLKELVVADEDVRKLDVDIAKERDGLEASRKDLLRIRDRLKKDRAEHDTLEGDRNSRMQEARVLGQQLDRSREKLNRTRNEKEVNAVQRELEETRKLLRDVEEAVGKRLVEIEALRKGISEAEEEEARVVARIGEVEGAVSVRLGELEGRRGELLKVREGIAKKLPAPTLRKYDQIRSRKTFGAARLEGGRCKACNMSIPPQLAARIARSDILDQCPSCSRFLIVDVTPSIVPPAP